mmetsp:Transcript_63222/g.126915  ORF Transcript_63222/g.126915 Transcript_63222/m.126915 type:complete len:273 (-) Transcript_63222:417-1235(-)
MVTAGRRSAATLVRGLPAAVVLAVRAVVGVRGCWRRRRRGSSTAAVGRRRRVVKVPLVVQHCPAVLATAAAAVLTTTSCLAAFRQASSSSADDPLHLLVVFGVGDLQRVRVDHQTVQGRQGKLGLGPVRRPHKAVPVLSLHHHARHLAVLPEQLCHVLFGHVPREVRHEEVSAWWDLGNPLSCKGLAGRKVPSPAHTSDATTSTSTANATSSSGIAIVAVRVCLRRRTFLLLIIIIVVVVIVQAGLFLLSRPRPTLNLFVRFNWFWCLAVLG